jgi:hypothetical protein
MRAHLIAVAVAVAGCKKPPPLFERVYALDEIPKFSITLSSEAANALAQRPREWVSGGFEYGEQSFPSIGVRLKGHRSLRKLDSKPSFKLQLDRFDDHKLGGQTSITLNNMVEDPSMLREVLAYRLYRALGVAAPNAGFAEVTVNGEPKGLYAVIESIDKKFLKRRFDDADGPMYEGEYGCDVIPADVSGFEADGGAKRRTAKDGKKRDKANHADRHELARFAAIAQGDARILFGPDSPLDVPAFLRFLAVEMYVGNFDGYRHGHNYRIYFEPRKQRWYFLPWGLDRTFVKNMSIFDSDGYLATRCFADAACRLAYVKTMREVVAEARRLKLEVGVDVISVVTKEAVARDSSARDASRPRHVVREFLVERPDEVERELGCIDVAGNEVDGDRDGYGCLDCNDRDAAVHPGATETCDGSDNNCNGLIDDDPTAGATCGCTPLAVDGVTFSLCELPMPYADAQQFCTARGQTLARLDTEAQAQGVLAAARPRKGRGRDPHVNDRWWIGLDDRAEEGTHRWLAGSTKFSTWDRGEPDNAGCNQDCVVFDLDDGKWSDIHCLAPRPFVCRAP